MLQVSYVTGVLFIIIYLIGQSSDALDYQRQTQKAGFEKFI